MFEFILLFLSLAFLSVAYYYRSRPVSVKNEGGIHEVGKEGTDTAKEVEGGKVTAQGGEEGKDTAKEVEGGKDSETEPKLTGGEVNAGDTVNSTSYHNPLVLAAIGWVLFGVYWWVHYEDYLEAEDMVNVALSLAALPFFCYIGYREFKSIPTGGLGGLKFLSGITIITMTGYVLVSEVPVIELTIEYINAFLVSGFLTLTGFPSEAGSIDFSGNPWLHRSNDNILAVPILHNDHDEILITLSCTAISSMILFTAAIFSATEARAVKVKTALLIIPSIFVLNIVRMAMITYFTYTGLTSPEFAHHILGKAGSLFVLLFLAWVLFTYLPSTLDNMSEVFDIIRGKGAHPASSSSSSKPSSNSSSKPSPKSSSNSSSSTPPASIQVDSERK